jgi:hypothetical protein
MLPRPVPEHVAKAVLVPEHVKTVPEHVVKAAGIAEGLGEEGQLSTHLPHQGTEVLLKLV